MEECERCGRPMEFGLCLDCLTRKMLDLIAPAPAECGECCRARRWSGVCGYDAMGAVAGALGAAPAMA